MTTIKKRREIIPLNLSTQEGVLNERKIFEFLYPDRKLKRTGPVLTPSAHSTTLCKQNTNANAAVKALLATLSLIKKDNLKLYYIAHLQLIAALRISEVLRIAPGHISSTGHIYIKGLKGSNDKVIYAGDAVNYMLFCKTNNISPFASYSRYFVYRQYARYNISFNSIYSSRTSVTHAIRHIAASSFNSDSVKDNRKQTLLGHKNPKNTGLYGKS